MRMNSLPTFTMKSGFLTWSNGVILKEYGRKVRTLKDH